MPPELALLLTLVFIAVLFWHDARERPNLSAGFWLPLCWMLINGSRTVSEWIGATGEKGSATLEDGTPIDRVVFIALIASGAYVLYRRRVNISEIVRRNVWLTIFFAYCFLAVFWSDFPFVAFKRWIKVLGHPIMALIILTEPDPREALRRLMKRSAYVLIPGSILFIKYYPELGRRFDVWSGNPFNIGVTGDKNALGYVCMILGFFFAWHVLNTLRQAKGSRRTRELVLGAGFLAMILWLLSASDSKTPLGALVVSVAAMAFLGLRSVDTRYAGAYLAGASISIAVAEMLFGIYEWAVGLLGRTVTLTDRTLIWDEVLKIEINPLLGAGFESFWVGARLDRLWDIFPFQPVQAHNGYLETYLNLGLLGLFVLGGLIAATFVKTQHELLIDRSFGQFRMGFLLAVVLYNSTEATFKALHLVWFVFYLIALDYPRKRATTVDGAGARRPARRTALRSDAS
jgi:exopolysaccharide production protein ExoQ